MRIILLGCPGSGKGTQSALLAEHFHIPKIATGDILRREVAINSDLGRQAKDLMEAGQYVPDSLMLSIIEARLQQSDCEQGYILDGFPRTLPQAEAFTERFEQVTAVIHLIIEDQVVIHRLSGRRVHPVSGRVYHATLNPPKQTDLDDVTGEALVHRKDDHPEVVQQRLAVYHEQTQPMIAYYQSMAKQGQVQYHTLNANQPVNDLQAQMVTLLTA